MSLELTPTDFRKLADRVTAIAADYLEHIDSLPNFPATSGKETEALFRTPLPEQGMGPAALDALADVVRLSRAQGPRFFGYVLGSGEPVGAVADLLASVINQNLTAWRSGPAAATIERTVVGWIAKAIGCVGFTGSLTGGGSPANLMGLAMAREAKAPANQRGAQPAVVYASQEVHMSIPKAVALLGLGRENLRLIAVDKNFRMDLDELRTAIRRDREAGKRGIAVVASAGTVSTGAIDLLRDIAGIAREHNLWMHVDGAYGALAAIAAPEKFDGLELADSLSLDPHKWLYQPLDCGCLLFRDRYVARTTFSHTGDYARTASADETEGFAFFDETMELSRRFRALRLWLSLRYHGMEAFRRAIRGNLEQAQHLARLAGQNPDLEVLAPVELSAVCFRYRKAGVAEAELNQLNAAILERVVRRGRVYLSNASVGGRFALRACITNHRTTDADVEQVVPEVIAAAKEIDE